MNELNAQKRKSGIQPSSQSAKSKETLEFEKLLSKAEKGDAEAQSSVGWHYGVGRGVTKDLNKSMAWFQKAIDKGWGNACYYAALIWLRENDNSKRLDYLRIGVSLNDNDCYRELYSDYHNGKHGVVKNENIALQLLKKGTDLKLPSLFFDRYLAHKYGYQGFSQNKEDIIFWLKRSVDYTFSVYLSVKDLETKRLYGESYKDGLQDLMELGCDYDPALHVDEFKNWMANKPTLSSSQTSTRQQQRTSDNSNGNTSASVKYHYTKSGKGQSQNTGQWTEAMAPEECEVEFFDGYITVNGGIQTFVKESGSWKVYGGQSMGWGGNNTTFYYYVDANKNMKQVCESSFPYGFDTFVYPMSMNGDPTPYNNTSSNYSDNSSGSSSNSNSSSTPPSRRYKCAYCDGGTIERNDNAPATYGQNRPRQKCPTCGKWYDPNVVTHNHQQCRHCGGTGYAK